MINESKIEKIIQATEKFINTLEKKKEIKNYEDELLFVSNLYKGLFIGLSDDSKGLFNKVYIKCRQDGNLISKSFRVACSILCREYNHTDGVLILKRIETKLNDIIELRNG